MSSQRKFTFAISSPDEFLVVSCHHDILYCTKCSKSKNPASQ